MNNNSINFDHVTTELRKHPAALLAAFESAQQEISGALSESQVIGWAEAGARIARQGPRAWEAAVEYYKVSPRVAALVGYSQFERWADSGADLAEEAPVVAAAYFRASPDVLPTLPPRHVAGWAALGRSLSRGTWKSASLAARFFDVSADLVSHVSFQELQQFVSLVQTLSNRSFDLAAEALVLGQRVLPAIPEREELISLATVLADMSWREVRGAFEAATRVGASVDRKLRRRYFVLTERLARMGMSNVSSFMLETAHALARLPQDQQLTVLEKAEALADESADAVAAFLRTSPDVLARISPAQLESWYAKGIELLKENPDGGIAYFKLESSRAEQVLDALSSAVELERVRGVLSMYANALAGSEVSIQPVSDLTSKNIGWGSADLATTDGTSVFLPEGVDQYLTKEENFAWLKVVTTHQVARLEFGSFRFHFKQPGAKFQSLRQQVAEGLGAQPGTTDISSYFDLFPQRALVADLFAVAEDARVDCHVLDRYRGLAPDYRKVQADALHQRPPIQLMPAQQAMVELVIRLSLHDEERALVPAKYVGQARELAALLRTIQDLDATVEDSAEAALRMYHIISQIPNEPIPMDDWVRLDLRDASFTEPTAQEVIENLKQQFEEANQQTEGEEYQSPEDVDYRGDFKPEMVQLLQLMRGEASEDGEMSDEQSQGISQELLEQILRESTELDFGDDDAEISTVAANLIKESATEQPAQAGKGYNQFVHHEEEGGSLEPTEPRSYAYDEWDFRANDYRPRWCIVQERVAVSGDTQFFTDTLHQYAGLMEQIRRQFEAVRPELYRKVRRLPEGEDIDLDAGIEALIDLHARVSPDERIYWRRNKDERDVGVVFLLDMSASTAEAVEESARDAEWNVPSDPVAYTAWLRARRGETARRPYKRIIDVEKESMVLLMTALEAIGDRYGVYGFSGFGRENVEFYVIKEVDEPMSDIVKRRLDKISPLHATRMGPAIRHATTKLAKLDAKTKFMFVISDGRPQDRGYSREGVEKEYAVQDTRMALLEARQKDITPFCLTVDRNGHDYLRTMAGDLGYEVLPDILELPRRLPYLYRKITV